MSEERRQRSRTSRFGPRAFGAFGASPLLSALAVLLLSACPDPDAAACPEACGRGLECDPTTATCVPTSLPRFERELPGRAVRVAAAAQRAWTASIDPSDGALVVAEHANGGDVDARVLTEFDRPEQKRVSITASARLVAVAWVGPQGRYDVAYRSLPRDSNASWRFFTIPEPEGMSYLGTESFDLEIVDSEGLALAFRDRLGALRILRASAPDAQAWSLETVDDGGPADDGTNCAEELRRVDPAIGVGFDPDLATRDETLVVAYHDADCGDLRIARRVSQRWSITIADVGEISLETGPTRGIVGRWPSLDIGPSGSVAVAYHDVSRGRLLYARENDGRYDVEVVDPGFTIDAFSRERKDVVGAFAHLTRSDDGAATITYLDGTSLDLEVARRATSAAEWNHQTVASSGVVGYFADHVVEADVGTFIAAEQLIPTGSGFESRLFIAREEP